MLAGDWGGSPLELPVSGTRVSKEPLRQQMAGGPLNVRGPVAPVVNDAQVSPGLKISRPELELRRMARARAVIRQ